MGERLTFRVEGDIVVGVLHLPAGSGPHPAAVVAGPMTSVKEQVTGVYARALAARGVAALAIDHRGFYDNPVLVTAAADRLAAHIHAHS